MARRTNALDQSDVSALCLVWGLPARVKRIQIKGRQARSSSNLLCFGRGGEQILWMVTGVVRGLREAVSYHRQFNHITNTTDYVSRHTHTASPILVRDVPLQHVLLSEAAQPVLLSRAATPTSIFQAVYILSLMVGTSRQTFLHLRSEVSCATTSTPPTYAFRLWKLVTEL